MTTARSEFLRVVAERGYMHQCTDLEALDKRLTEGPAAAYIGFDCTAESLHVGGLMQIMLLRWWQKTGNKPIVLMGGGTTRIGDPTGKDEARKMLSDADIARNMAGIKKVFAKYLTFGDGTSDAMMVNNADWLDQLNYIAFLRDYGKHFTINRMMTFDSVKLRLEREQPLTFLEFNYMILQGYDFAELWNRHKCVLQMGGSDQWGNIVNGVELGRRVHQAELYGLTSPLLTTSSGAKMGKTVGGAVWLNADMLSSWEFWQYWRNTEDADVGRFLKLYTELPLAEIAKLEALQGAEINEAKKILAHEVTKLCHGEAAALEAAETARKTFEQGGLSDNLPTVTLPAGDLAAGMPAFALFVRAGLAASNGEARRLLQQGGGRVNDAQVTDPAQAIGNDAVKDGVIKLTAGKKRHVLVKPE
ncbi:tyrosine--tRNA ligase [Magnetospirillum sp. 64-120]|uniref:tyrosine--tRNA ligase n=1 Tax=Magnetospirillum sp. 64-120 TaxID=1895778 RepID=UPI00092C1593|nr:tyrosine--tRNA ligase [Magnetospirillum sp. 64-120]OJX80858.1 MAG: tyrosine--tRNA ligase [Magnetospirillum sp. 64-120]